MSEAEMIFKLVIDKQDTHVHFRVFAGTKRGALGLAGSLCMRLEEFVAFQSRLDAFDVEQAWRALL